jgi:RNA polymerase sigma-70 factor (ECF subfamily)
VPEPSPASTAPTLEALYAAHAAFVWRSLFRLGVRSGDLEDMLQEVFVVVHRRLDRFDPTHKPTTWLFGICLRVASDYRRRRRRKPEAPLPEGGAELTVSTAINPEQEAVAREAQARVELALDAMSEEKRAVFVLYELERMSCGEIAELLGVRVGTIHSRLHAARAEFRAAFDRSSEVSR